MSGLSRNTQNLIDAASAGDSAAQKQLFSILYKELHAMAHRAMLKEQFDDMLQTTALVHEAYLSLVKDKRTSWRNKKHFYRVAARVMRCILVDEARKRTAAKRNPLKPRLSLDAPPRCARGSWTRRPGRPRSGTRPARSGAGPAASSGRRPSGCGPCIRPLNISSLVPTHR